MTSGIDGIDQSQRAPATELERRAEIDAAITDTLLESAPVGFALFDRDLRFVRVNPRLAEINGPSVDEHLGRFVWDVVPGLRDAAEALLRSVIDTGEPVRDVEITGETPAQPGVIRHWLESFFPVRTTDGETIGVAAIAAEITDRIRLERQLADTASLLDTVLSVAPVGLALIDADHRYVHINAALARLNGVELADHLGRRISDVLPADTAAQVSAIIERVLTSAEPVTDEHVAGTNAAGDFFEVVAHYSPVRRPDHTVTGVGIAVVDLTDHFAAERHRRRQLQDRVTLQREALEAVQRTLLPTLPTHPTVRIATRYLAAATVARIGGDWYDAFELDDGTIVVAVGDAVGHGIEAVRTMDTARHTLRTLALDGRPLTDALARTNTVLHHHREYATLALAALQPHTGTLTVLLAGHPPPLLRHPDGTTSLLDDARGPLLGRGPDATWPAGHHHLPAGTSLLLYTDGLIERRGEHPDDGIARLRIALRDRPTDDETAATALTDAALDGTHLADDACLLLLTRPALPIPTTQPA